MKYRYGFAAFLTAFIIQTTLIHHMAILDVAPNLILILVIAFSFLFDEKHGIVFGILFGLLQDVFFAPVIGISALCYFLVSLGIGEVRRYLYRDNILSVAFIAFGGTLGYYVLFWILSAMFGSIYQITSLLGRLPLEMLLNMMILMVVYWFIVRKVIKYRGFKYM